MVKYGIISVLVAGMLAVSCGEKSRRKAVKQTVKTPLIHPLFFQEEIAAQLNFPFWFNDSLIRAQHIHTITWTVFRSTEIDPENPHREERYPKARTVYTFDDNGRLTQLQRSDFSEGLTIASKTYAIVPSSTEYSHVKQLELSSLGSDGITETFTFLKPVRSNARISQYDDNYADVRYHFFPDKKYHGALSVDSIGHPGATDWIVLGTPERPEKRYQVRNTVTESNVTHYTYLDKNYPNTITWSDYPFTQKRHFTYAKNGVFTGFIDSTYIDQAFVTRNVSYIVFDKRNRPAEITHRKGHAASGTHYQTIEKIRYTSFPSP